MDNVTVIANVIEGTSINPDVSSGATVQTNVVYGTPVTANVVTGAPGEKGDPGDPGEGVPAGGTTGQILAKIDGTDFNAEWVDEPDLSGYATTSDLTTGLAGKANTVHTHAASQVTDFDAAVAANSAVTANTAKISFDASSSSKLAGIEAGADVTDTTNVNAAGAFMKSVDDTDDITVGTTNKFATAAEKAKLANITVTQAVDLDTMESDIAGKQPLDSDLTTIAGLTPTTDNFMVATASAWASRTPSQARTQLGLGALATLSTVTETEITLADVTTNDFSTTKHGFVPKGTNTGKFLKDDGTWASIPGGGDMLAATYDPQAIASDAFDQDNMTDGATNKNYTATEQTKLAGIETGADVTDAVNIASSIVGVAGKTDPADADTIPLIDSAASNALKELSISDLKIEVGKAMWPVGSIYTSINSTNPGTSLGFGTWTAFGAGRVPVGYDSGQTEFDTDEETGGAKTHTLTTAEMPSHTHTQDAHTHTQNAHNHGISARWTAGGTTDANHLSYAWSGAGGGGTYGSNNATATNQNTTATNQNTGGGGAHNNLQPYIVVRMWKRTA